MDKKDHGFIKTEGEFNWMKVDPIEIYEQTLVKREDVLSLMATRFPLGWVFCFNYNDIIAAIMSRASQGHFELIVVVFGMYHEWYVKHLEENGFYASKILNKNIKGNLAEFKVSWGERD